MVVGRDMDEIFFHGRTAAAIAKNPEPLWEESEQIPIILVLHNADYMGVSWAHEWLEPGRGAREGF